MNEASADRLRKARIKRGFETPTEAARFFGWTSSTYVSHENGTRGLTPEAARRYAAAFKVSAGWLLGLHDVERSSVNEVTIVGEAAFGIWREKHLDVEHKANRSSLSVPQRDGDIMQFAVYVSDQSVNRAISQNEYAICRPIGDAKPAADGLYYVQRERGNLVEKTIRLAKLARGGEIEFMSHSTDARYRDDKPASSSSDHFKILGVVVGKYCDLKR